jgi:sigma-B regulation protein RsbU (phosphoserine phosphatase)
VQTTILPRRFDVRGLELAAAMVPADEVGGDYYDVLPFPGGCWLAIGDVSGHGLNSGLVMLMVQSALSATVRAKPYATPRDVLATLNDVMFDNIRNRLQRDDHVTFSLLRYTRDGSIVHSGAHEDLLILRRSGVVESQVTPGTWVGGRPDIGPANLNTTFKLEDGDVLVLFTDGITEARNAQGEMFDMARLRAALAEAAGGTPERIRDHVLATVRRWTHRQFDDITLVVARYKGLTTL